MSLTRQHKRETNVSHPFHHAATNAPSEIQIAMAKIGLVNGPQYTAPKFVPVKFLLTYHRANVDGWTSQLGLEHDQAQQQ